MRAVVFSVTDPHGKRWAQLLDVDLQIRLYLQGLAQTYGLPRELNYVLVPKGADYPLDANRTLAQLRVPAGADLYLQPLRDQILKMLLDKLYDEVKDNIKDQLMDLAKEKLKQILDLDPSYPDPLHLKDLLFGESPLAPMSTSSGQKSVAQKTVQHAPTQSKLPQLVKPKPGISPAWIIAGVLGGGALLVVTGIVIVSVIGILINAADQPSVPIPNPNDGGNGPGIVTEEMETGPILGTGDVQITLRWNAPVDLDLHVIDPNQEEISYSHRSSRSGGQLDVDANPACNSMMANPVENVFWPYGGAPGGWYGVIVVYYADCGNNTGPVDYELTIRLNGQVYDVIRGTIYEVRESQSVTSFSR